MVTKGRQNAATAVADAPPRSPRRKAIKLVIEIIRQQRQRVGGDLTIEPTFLPSTAAWQPRTSSWACGLAWPLALTSGWPFLLTEKNFRLFHKEKVAYSPKSMNSTRRPNLQLSLGHLRWRDGEMTLRVAGAFLLTEKNFRKIMRQRSLGFGIDSRRSPNAASSHKEKVA